MQCFESLIDGSDVIAVLPTGYGQSLLFQLLPDILPTKTTSNVVLVVTPLNLIIEDQLIVRISSPYFLNDFRETCHLTPGGGVHNMLRVRVCAAHMGGFLGPKFSKQGSLFGRFSIKEGGLSRNWRKIAKNGWFSAKIHHKSGYDGNFR